MKTKLQLILTILLFCAFQRLVYAQAPNLGSASNFVVFTSIGAFDNLGNSTITGDIGTDAGAFSGFPPGTLVGQIHQADASSLQAVNDLSLAFDELSALTCNTVLPSTLGSSQVLSPDVYCINSAASLSGDLILDGQNDPNALFIFKIDGALSAANFSNIILINDANLCNVYWQITGAFSLGDNSVFNGTLLADGAISLYEGSSIFGRVLTKKGAISLQNIRAEICVASGVSLPLNLSSFEGVIVQKNSCIHLIWQTVSENNSSFFLVEKSVDAKDFKSIGVKGAANQSSELLHYTFDDKNPLLGLNYYRLKQYDANGVYVFSETIVVDFQSNVSIYPNPFQNEINVSIRDMSKNDQWEIKIMDVFGKLIKQTECLEQQSIINTKELPKGVYFYTLVNNKGVVQNGKLISQN